MNTWTFPAPFSAASNTSVIFTNTPTFRLDYGVARNDKYFSTTSPLRSSYQKIAV